MDDEQEDEDDDDDNVVITTERPEQEVEQQQQQHADEELHDQTDQHQAIQQSFDNRDGNGNGNFGFDQNQQGFGGMDFSNMNNFNPMMMMQNGMGLPNFDMGMQNMMGEYLKVFKDFKEHTLRRAKGMPGMNMDPSMMFNGGFGGMGGMNDMSMMNIGMGMGDMSGFGGMPGMGNMGGGPGFFPGNGGYNQQSFGNNMHQNQNFHHNRGYGGRPYGRGFRGRGWGGYNRGRGNWQNNGGHFQGNQNYMNQQGNQHQQNSPSGDDTSFSGQQQPHRRGSPSYEPMNGVEKDATKQSAHTTTDDSGVSNQADVNATNQTGDSGGDVEKTDADGEQPEPVNGEISEGKHGLFQRLQAHTDAQILVGSEEYAEDSVEDATKDASVKDTNTVPLTKDANTEGGAEHDSYVGEGQESHAAVKSGPQDQYYDQQYQQGFGYGARGRGGFRGGRGGFRGRGGTYGYVSTPGEAQAQAAPPINAPTGPKAFREGKPNSGFYSRPQPPAAPQVSSTIAAPPNQAPARDERGRSRSRSRPGSEHGQAQEKEKEKSGDHHEESDEARHEKRRRRDDEYESERNGVVNGDKSNHKGKAGSETPEDGKSRRKHRDDERRDSRSHRDRSRDKHRRRHRSRSPEKELSDREGEANGSRHKSKSDRRRESRHDESEYSRDKERSRKSSHREDDHERGHKDRSNNSSKHRRSGREERDRDRERELDRRPVLEEPQDDIGFKIKGSKSAALQAEAEGKSMAPPTTFGRDRDSRRQSTSGTPKTPAGDPYAEERERRQRERLDRENTLRRQSTQSLGKRTSRDDEEFEAPMGPKSDTGRGGKKARRKVSYKYEDEVGDGYEDRDRDDRRRR